MKSDTKKIITIGIIAAILIVAGVTLGKFWNTVPKEVLASLTVAPVSMDLGEVSMAKGNVTKIFILKNNGDEDILITSIQTSCMCTEAEVDSQVFGMHGSTAAAIKVKAGTEKPMNVTYNPNAHGPAGVGLFIRQIMIRTNSKTTPYIEARIEGNTIP